MVTTCLSSDLHADGIMAVSLHPGYVQTRMGFAISSQVSESYSHIIPPITPQESVTGMLKVMSELIQEDSGKLFDYNGDILPW